MPRKLHALNNSVINNHYIHWHLFQCTSILTSTTLTVLFQHKLAAFTLSVTVHMHIHTSFEANHISNNKQHYNNDNIHLQTSQNILHIHGI